MRVLVQVFRSPRKQETYLYVAKAHGLVDVPDDLMNQFGEPEAIMTLVLEPSSKLARANAAEVLADIAGKGFYLQMPPTAAELLRRDGQGE